MGVTGRFDPRHSPQITIEIVDMMPNDTRDDMRAIEALLSSQFQSINWQPNRNADWTAFFAGFVAGAALFPAARPATPQTPEGFSQRMEALRLQGKLTSFQETELGRVVHVFGNVAVAMVGCKMLENGSSVTRDVSGFLLIKDNKVWRIAAQAWDIETEFQKIPDYLAENTPG